jgi:hypothetical protein
MGAVSAGALVMIGWRETGPLIAAVPTRVVS